MEFLGKVNEREIYYLSVRNNPNWHLSIPNEGWVAFTIANEEDKKLILQVVKMCLDKNVSYTCSAGNLAHFTEELFDEEIVERAVNYEIKAQQMITNFHPVPQFIRISVMDFGLQSR